MAANDKKRFYWLKLKEDFFKNYKIKALKALPNGRFYVLIYIELLAESTSHEGQLRFSKTLPYDYITLASVIDEDPDIVKSAIEAFCRLELAEILDDETIYMREIQKLIGSETGDAERKREYRKNLKGDNVPRLSGKCPQEIRDKSIEYRDNYLCNESIGIDDDDKYKSARTRDLIIERWTEAGYEPEDIEEVFRHMKNVEITESNFRKIYLVLHEPSILDSDAYIATMRKNGDLTSTKGAGGHE